MILNQHNKALEIYLQGHEHNPIIPINPPYFVNYLQSTSLTDAFEIVTVLLHTVDPIHQQQLFFYN